MAGIKALRKIQLGLESVKGTAVVATAVWRGLGTIEDQREVVVADEDVGLIPGSDRTYTVKQQGALSMEPVPATFEQLPYILAAGVEDVVSGSADGGGSGKIYAYNFPIIDAVNAHKTYTIEGGDNQEKEEMAYCHVPSFKLTGRAGEALMMSAEWIGRQVSTLDVSGTGIAFVSATKKITDTGSGLAGFLTGTTIKVTGSVSNNDIYTVATGGVAGEIVTTEALVDEGAGASVLIQDWFTGGPNGLSLPTVEEILFSKGKLYVDAVGGTIGSTLKSNTLLGMNLQVNTGLKAIYSADGNAFFGFTKFVRPEITCELTLEHDAISMALKDDWRAETTRLFRVLWQGAALGTAGTTYTYKTLILDMAAVIEKVSKIDEQDGNDILNINLRARYNSTAAKFCDITVVNELASLT